METNPKSKLAPNIIGLLLCAGLSGRMGTSKALLIFDGLPFAVHIIKKLNLVCDKIIVVTGYESEKVEKEIKKYLGSQETKKVIFIFNTEYKAGMFTSLQCGLRNIYRRNWILYHFVDQPSLPVSFYKEFVEQLSSKINWLQPSFNNKLGHPILFNSKVADNILRLKENNSLRDLSNDQRITKLIWNCNYPEVLEDIDTIDQFNNLTIKSFDN